MFYSAALSVLCASAVNSPAFYHLEARYNPRLHGKCLKLVQVAAETKKESTKERL